MNRRNFLSTVSSLAASALVPSWLPKIANKINLMPFCTDNFRRYSIAEPFIQNDQDGQPFQFATNARICLKLATSERPTNNADIKLPPASELPWFEGKEGWRSWPKRNYLMATESECPDCDGEGFVCVKGFCETCRTCGGKGEGTFPDVQQIDYLYVCRTQDNLMRQHLSGIEYYPHVFSGISKNLVIPFRFDGGHGLLCPLSDLVQRRIKAAKGNQ
jgi:hypothetical protein